MWQELEVPVIAAVHGVALGGGIQIALGADLRFVAPDAQLSVLEIRWGLVPDMTGTLMLPRLVGLDVAKELTFTGRMVSGEEAGRIGLATRVTADAPRGRPRAGPRAGGEEPGRGAGRQAPAQRLRDPEPWPSTSPPSGRRSASSSAAPTRSRPSPPTSRSGTRSSGAERAAVALDQIGDGGVGGHAPGHHLVVDGHGRHVTRAAVDRAGRCR